MPFDLRIPLGLMFTIFGLILINVSIFGAADLRPSLGIDINLWWGLFLLVFGSAIFGSWRWRNRKK